ncbi:unnamed protein product [Clonostachys solani]|uniref:Uncharacterized protein n=1 Tax=Clonostachys solani TaxID=160281 RepID=A0A9P0ERV9_9HYPO|nr:unnamed protein product [Clonostachys solani]
MGCCEACYGSLRGGRRRRRVLAIRPPLLLHAAPTDAEDAYKSFHGALVLGDNQWFIPHCYGDAELFKHFRTGYVEAGNAILKEKEWVGKFDLEMSEDITLYHGCPMDAAEAVMNA